MKTTDHEWAARVEEHYVDKSEFKDGPWMEEPDRVEWRFAGTPRFPLLIVRGPSGALCGYVGLPPGHQCHGKDYSQVEDDVRVHGGLTYSAPCVESGKICHVPRAGESDEVFWLGFDCAHAGDIAPSLLFSLPSDTYKSIDYVRDEVERLAQQCAAKAKGE